MDDVCTVAECTGVWWRRKRGREDRGDEGQEQRPG